MIRACKVILRQSTLSINCFIEACKMPAMRTEFAQKENFAFMAERSCVYVVDFSPHLTWMGSSRWMRILLIMFRHFHTAARAHMLIFSICHEVCGLILFRLTVSLCKQTELTRKSKVWIICNE